MALTITQRLTLLEAAIAEAKAKGEEQVLRLDAIGKRIADLERRIERLGAWTGLVLEPRDKSHDKTISGPGTSPSPDSVESVLEEEDDGS